MLKRLDLNRYGLVRSLFAPMNHHLAIESILAGLTPAPVYVDHLQEPQLTLTWTKSRIFLAGKAGDETILHALGESILKEFYPLCATSGPGAFTLMYTPGWRQDLERVLANQNLIRDVRNYYRLDAGDFTRKVQLPAGHEMLPVSRALLETGNLSNLENVLAEMRSERPSIDDFLLKSFGFCVVHENAIVAWCMSEYNVQDQCELGIFTLESYRRRGLAMATATAVIRKAIEHGINKIGWHCWRSNEPSKATAATLGFALQHEESVLFAYTDPLENLAVNGYVALRDKNTKQALLWFDRAMEMGNLPAWAVPYFEKAQETHQEGDNDV